MTRIGAVLARLAASAAAGALVTFGAGQVVSLFTDSCSLICQPEVAIPFGAIMGALAFYPTGRD